MPTYGGRAYRDHSTRGSSMAHFIPIAGALAAPLLNQVCFRLKPLHSMSESPARTTSVNICRFGMDLFWTAEL